MKVPKLLSQSYFSSILQKILEFAASGMHNVNYFSVPLDSRWQTQIAQPNLVIDCNSSFLDRHLNGRQK